MKKYHRLLLSGLFLILFGIHVCSADPNTYNYKDFKKMISQFQDYSIVPSGGEFHTLNDYTKAYANINKSTFKNVTDSAKNFAFSATMSWDSATETPNSAYAGCGIRFRSNSEGSALFAILRMDGHLTFESRKQSKVVDRKSYYFGHPNIEATHNLTVVANGNNVKLYISGKQYADIREVAVTGNGGLYLATVSGTNKDWGTRCKFTNINYYTW